MGQQQHGVPGGVKCEDVLAEVHAAAVVLVKDPEEGVRQELGVLAQHRLKNKKRLFKFCRHFSHLQY